MSGPSKKRSGGKKKAVVRRDELGAKPRPAGNSRGAPKTLRELGERVKRSLYATVDGLFALAVDVVAGTRRIVRKLPEYAPELIKSALITPRISEAIAKRVERADKKEAEAQAKAAATPATAATPSAAADAQDRLRAVLEGFQAKGLHVEILDVKGVPTIVVVRPELADAARAIATAPPATAIPAISSPAAAADEVVVEPVARRRPVKARVKTPKLIDPPPPPPQAE